MLDEIQMRILSKNGLLCIQEKPCEGRLWSEIMTQSKNPIYKSELFIETHRLGRKGSFKRDFVLVILMSLILLAMISRKNQFFELCFRNEFRLLCDLAKYLNFHHFYFLQLRKIH